MAQRHKQRDILDFLNTAARLSQARSSAKRNEILEAGIKNAERNRAFYRRIKEEEIEEKRNRVEARVRKKSWADSISLALIKAENVCQNCGYISIPTKNCGKCKRKLELDERSIIKSVVALENAAMKIYRGGDLVRSNLTDLPKILQFYFNERIEYIRAVLAGS